MQTPHGRLQVTSRLRSINPSAANSESSGCGWHPITFEIDGLIFQETAGRLMPHRLLFSHEKCRTQSRPHSPFRRPPSPAGWRLRTRHTLLGREPKDFDVATDATPDVEALVSLARCWSAQPLAWLSCVSMASRLRWPRSAPMANIVMVAAQSPFVLPPLWKMHNAETSRSMDSSWTPDRRGDRSRRRTGGHGATDHSRHRRAKTTLHRRSSATLAGGAICDGVGFRD